MFTRYISQTAREFARDARGNFVTLFAIVAPVMLVVASAAISFSSSVTYQKELQAAVDSAALASTAAITRGAITTDAQTIAENFFAANAPNYSAGAGTLTVTPSVANNAVSTAVSYTTTAPASLVGGLTGSFTQTLTVTATANAQLTTARQSFAGSGGLWGDPHLTAADGSESLFPCVYSPVTWYSGLSDAGIELNFTCQYFSYWNYMEIQDIYIMAGGHTILTTENGPPSYTTNSDGSLNFDYSGTGWLGQFTLDGKIITPDMTGYTEYLDDSNLKVATWIDQLKTPNQYDNYLQITYTNGSTKYYITITYGVYGEAQISFTATNAGLCGTPGGIWGNTLGGVDNSNAEDFLLPSQTSTSFQYDWTACTSGDPAVQSAHLTK